MKTGRLLIDIIRFELTGDESDALRDAELSPEAIARLYDAARAHDMAHIVAAYLDGRGLLSSDEVSNKFVRANMLSVYRYERMNHDVLAACELLDKNGIEHMLLKGAIFRVYYPKPQMRQSGDVDLLVPQDKLERATELLCGALDYTVSQRSAHDITMKSPSGVMLELH